MFATGGALTERCDAQEGSRDGGGGSDAALVHFPHFPSQQVIIGLFLNNSLFL